MVEDLETCRLEFQRLQVEMSRLADRPDDPSTRTQLMVLRLEFEKLINQLSLGQEDLKKQLAGTTRANQVVAAYAQASRPHPTTR